MYVLDAFMTIEGNRLEWIRQNQRTIRAENYGSLANFVEQRQAAAAAAGQATAQPIEVDNEQIGQRIILPSTFRGSIRQFQESYRDAMSVVAKKGKPDLFITFTANPQWKEIRDNCPPHDDSNFRPDIESRVMKLKIDEFIRDVKKNNIFGRSVAYLHVIEFQKRGRPHAHIVITLAVEDKLVDSDSIDQVVCAELPNPLTHPRLHAIVTKAMLHGPCGQANPRQSCMDKGRCTKHYPKRFTDETQPNVNGYPQYRRRNDGRHFSRRHSTYQFDNQHVIPYNAYLLLKYNCHINVEVCTSIRCIKYLFKYIHKGHDRANVAIEEKDKYNEIACYLNCRYLCAQEACWRLSQFEMEINSHTIYRMQLHAPDQQRLYFQEGNERQAVEGARNSMLMAWFELNRHDVYARTLLYAEVGEKYVWNKSRHVWTLRQVGVFFSFFFSVELIK
jgi:hypothetical protein